MICIAFKNKNSFDLCNRKAIYKSCLCGYHKNYVLNSPHVSEYINSNTNDNNNIISSNIEDIYILKKIKLLWSKLIIAKCISKYLNKKNKIFYDMLNANFPHFLLEGQDSWTEINIINIIKVNDSTYYDIYFLVNYLESSLNNSNMNQPYPIYPRCPFTRKMYNKSELQIIKNKIKKNNIKMNIVLTNFFKLSYIRWYNYTIKTNKDNTTENIRKGFYKKMRYKLVNKLDSQNNFMGYWTHKNEINSIFEELYIEWVKIPPYLVIAGELYQNPEKKKFWDILISCK
jgi:hypothetical protein